MANDVSRPDEASRLVATVFTGAMFFVFLSAKEQVGDYGKTPILLMFLAFASLYFGYLGVFSSVMKRMRISTRMVVFAASSFVIGFGVGNRLLFDVAEIDVTFARCALGLSLVLLLVLFVRYMRLEQRVLQQTQ